MIGLEPSPMENPSTYPHFFGFSQKPFGVEPDLESLFLVKSQKEALISMIQGINERRGLVLISGEKGTGKTALLHCLQTKLGRNVKTVFISRLSIFFKEGLKQITQELGLPLADETPGFLISQLRAHLAAGLGRNENVVIFVDDAQQLNKENFEELRLLSQMQEGGVRLLQIILAGRPELEAILESEGLRPFNRQIQLRLQIPPLLPEESRLFIEQRLQRAWRSSAEVFTPEGLDLIVSQGCGIFQNIIFLCDKAFQKGFELQQRRIDAPIIRDILADMGVPLLKGKGGSPEITSPDALIHRLFQNPPRIRKPGIRADVSSYLKHHPLYLYIPGTIALALVFYLGWEFFLAPSPSRAPRIETSTKIGRGQMPIPAPQEKVEPSAQNAPPAPPDKKAEIGVPAPERAASSSSPEKPEAEEKIEKKPSAKEPPKQAAKAESRKESKPELKTDAGGELRFNEPVEVPKGKTLYAFARDYYHQANPTLIDYILESNAHLKDMDRIPTDRKIEIPEISERSLLAQFPDGSWKIRLGTFESRQAGRAFKEEPLLKGKEIEAAPRQVSPEKTWYRLYAGKFDTREEALKTIQELRKKGLLPAFKK